MLVAVNQGGIGEADSLLRRAAEDVDRVLARVLGEPTGERERLEHPGLSVDRESARLADLPDDRHRARLGLFERDRDLRRDHVFLEARLELAREPRRRLPADLDVTEEGERDPSVRPDARAGREVVLPEDVERNGVPDRNLVFAGRALVRRQLGDPRVLAILRAAFEREGRGERQGGGEGGAKERRGVHLHRCNIRRRSTSRLLTGLTSNNAVTLSRNLPIENGFARNALAPASSACAL